MGWNSGVSLAKFSRNLGVDFTNSVSLHSRTTEYVCLPGALSGKNASFYAIARAFSVAFDHS